MKKITLILAVASVASSAMALKPLARQAEGVVLPQQSLQLMDRNTPVCDRINIDPTDQSVIRRANSYKDDDSTLVFSTTSRNLLYSGLTADCGMYAGQVAVGGYKGTTTYQSLKDDYSNWYVEPASSYATAVAGNYSGASIEVPNALVQNYYTPLMINGTDTLTNNAALWGYSFGLTTTWWGYSSAPGLGTCAAPWKYDSYWACSVGAMSKDQTATSRYEANGTYSGWGEVFGVDASGITTTGFGHIFPKTTTPYVVSQYWLEVAYTATEETQIDLAIYPIVDGAIDTTAPIAKGSTIVEAGNDGYFLVFDLVPVDADGDETDGFISIDSQVAVIIDLNNEAITQFVPYFYNSTVYPTDGNFSDYFDNHAFMAFAYQDEEGAEHQVSYRCPWVYGAGTENYYPSDPMGYFDAIFPYVYNAATSEDAFDYTFNAELDENNEAVVYADSYYDIPELFEAGYMEASTDDDWFEYEVGTYTSSDGYSFTAISVNAAELPEGVKGRVGKINFTGAGQDFTVNVIQGDIAGISNVTVANSAASEYFDLQGRRLSAAPANGVYIERQGNTVSKVIR